MGEVLRSSGLPLDANMQRSAEAKFRYDFSAVRVHADDRAARSAQAVNAQAYAVGSHLVFAPGRYRPQEPDGRRLLLHELGHVVQQRGATIPSRLEIGTPESSAELEAERAANATPHDRVSPKLTRTAPAVMRTLSAEAPQDKIPNPGGSGLDQTNAKTLEQYLQKLSPQGNPRVDPASGKASMDAEFCPSRGQRFLRGLGSGFLKGAEIGAYFLGVGAIPGALIGAIAGGISGLAEDRSKTGPSKTPVGSSCICDFINSDQAWRVQFLSTLDDDNRPVTGDQKYPVVRVPSPNSPKLAGSATVSGQLQTNESWLVLGHELCGHAWLEMHGQNEGDKQGEDLRHHRTVERENLIRQEHGMEARGFHLKDPYCGQSFVRDASNPGGPAQWLHANNTSTQKYLRDSGQSAKANETDLDTCQQAREQHLGDLAKQYRVDQRIP